MDTAIYYTCSTVAQVLASAFGFLVAVALYRMEIIRGSIGNLSKRRGEAINSMKSAGPNIPKEFTTHYHSIEKFRQDEEEKLSSVKSRLRRSLLWTAGDIIACMILMPFTPFFAGRSLWIPWLTLCGIVGTAAYTISTYVELALEITSSQAAPTTQSAPPLATTPSSTSSYIAHPIPESPSTAENSGP